MKTAKFTATGGRISAEVTCEPRRDGSYELRLWHRDLNKKIKEWGGNFWNTDDDKYDLPAPASVNNGRALQALIVIAVPSGVSPSTVSLVVRQSEKELTRDSRIVEPGSVDRLVQLWVVLELVAEE